ncbi:hypothetical protein ABMA28_001435 [Loxostege sticticalis]|uniref:FLYWCH-type domain-containing protein n=1 Tax=Loxostege sticticalis TaxID=481309 RepID=A0ABD0T1N9_LOXSC
MGLHQEHSRQVQCQTVFVMSRKGKSLISLDGYTYYNKRKSLTHEEVKKRWVCSTHFHRGCRAVIYTVQDIIVAAKKEHNHWPTSCNRTQANPY